MDENKFPMRQIRKGTTAAQGVTWEKKVANPT